jgi:exosortase/archaeosortase family protein
MKSVPLPLLHINLAKWFVRMRVQIVRHGSNRRSLWLLLAGFLFIWITLLFTWADFSPNVQVLNLMIWFGGAIALEDQMAALWPRPSRFSFCCGTALLTAILVRGSFIANVHDRFTLILLPLTFISLALLNQPVRRARLFLVPVIVSLLFPIGLRILALADYLQDITAQLSWIILTSIGFQPVVSGNKVMLASGGVTITGYCTGVDQLMVCLVVAAIFLMVFPLRYWSHRLIAVGIASLAALIVNAIRISILAWLVSLPDRSGMFAFEFLHDSYGGLVFSLIAVGIFGWSYTALVDREIAFMAALSSVPGSDN